MSPDHSVELNFQSLDTLLPMHAVVDDTGHILNSGPTLQKLFPDCGPTGRRFLEVFELRRPRDVDLVGDILNRTPQHLSLRMRHADDIRLKGISLPLPGREAMLVNLSFGISAAEVVRRYGLGSGDFAATDLTIEMLYLIEAKEAVTEESRNLNMRLLGAKSEAEEQAFTDTLTGLKNRRAMDVILARYQSCGEKFSLMQLDLDHFKAVNDTMGHAAGDAVLVEAARVLTEETRAQDAIIRTGGDEFVLLFHGLTETRALNRISNRILERLEQPVPFDGQLCRISGSIGITISDDYDEIDPEQMMLDADVALYASKKAGRAQHTFVRDVGGVGQTASSMSEAPPLERAS